MDHNEKMEKLQKVMQRGMRPKKAPTLEEQHDHLVNDLIPDWQNPDVQSQDKLILRQRMYDRGMTNNEIDALTPERIKQERDIAFQDLRQQKLDTALETAKADAKLSGKDGNKDAVLSNFMQDVLGSK